MKKDILKLVRPNILALEPYSTARDEYEGGDIDVWLDANENPFDNGVNRYPDPHQLELKGQLSQIKGVAPKKIFIGNGSDEAIDLIFRVFARPGVDNAVSIAPTYGMYKVSASINDVEIKEVQLGENFELPVEALLEATDENTKIMWICSPNNPTGNQFEEADVVALLERFDGIVVVDEAYIDFARGAGFLPRLDEFSNLIVLQTMSKAWGMAGLRFGLAYASEEIIRLMDMAKSPYNINVLTQARVAEQLKKGIDAQVATIMSERARVIKAFESMDSIEKVFPTDANFVLIRVADANGLYDKLVEGGVIVRNRSKILGCANTLRVTIGTEAENDRMLKIITEFK
ncbi:MAG: histidinol-phosphate transaminase [Rikenellaceae bacterium]